MTSATPTPPAEPKPRDAVRKPLVQLEGLELAGSVADREQIAQWIPHRHEMALLDTIVWHSDDFAEGVARWSVRDDEFWVRGHFPEKAMLPGVLNFRPRPYVVKAVAGPVP